jgi:phosphate uptake regulator
MNLYDLGNRIEYRKLIGFGNGSIIVTIPRSWMQNNELRKGDVISVSQVGSDLILESQKKHVTTSRDALINADNKSEDYLKVEIVSAYLNGCDSIVIQAKDINKRAQEITSILRNLSGMEIMGHSSAKITAKNIISLSEISIDNIIRRMDMILRSMMDDVMRAVIGQTVISLHDRDRDVNRLYYLGTRTIKLAMTNPQIARNFNRSSWQLHSDRLMMIRLEKIGDCQKRIALLLGSSNIDSKIVKKLEPILATIKEQFERVMKSYYTENLQIALSIDAENRSSISSCNDFLDFYLLSQRDGGPQEDKASNSATMARVTEHLKSMVSQLKYMARYVLTRD